MRYQFYTLDVFTDRAFGGNQLAVLPDARGLSPTQMQNIAGEFNFSETTFVLPPENPDYTRRVRIFTPGQELPFAGHPTVGTAFALAAHSDIPLEGDITRIIFEEGVGPVPVAIYAEDGQPVVTQLTAARLPEFGPAPPAREVVAAMLSLDPNDLLMGKYGIEAVSCGTPFLFVPLRDRDAVARATLDLRRWRDVLSEYWTSEVFIFAFDPELPESDLRARMFAPAAGIIEDPATGAAATALGGYLGKRDETQTGTLHWRVEQGFEMGRPSIIDVEADKAESEITEIRVGGRSVLVSEGTIDVPAETRCAPTSASILV